MGSLLVQTRETTERTWLYIKDALKQDQTLLYQIRLNLIQYKIYLTKIRNRICLR